jgi:phage terminase large subunit-like protein
MSGIMDKWKALAVSRKEFLELIRGREAYAGGDLSKRIDLTADAHVIPLDDGRYAVTAHGFIPEESATKHEHSDRVPYRHWASDDWCTITPGAVTDYKFLATHLDEFEFDNRLNVLEECYDPYNASHFMQEREAAGKTVIEIRQGVQTLSEPTKFFRELMLQGRLVHDGNPLLTWCLSNAVEVVDNNGNIKLSKKHKDDSQRIDLAAAVINGMVRAMVAEDNRSIYEKRGMRSLAD